MTLAQDFSFHGNCGVVSADGTSTIRLLDRLTDLPAPTQERIASGKQQDDVLRVSGLEITYRNLVTQLVITNSDWTTLTGIAVGMTQRDVHNLGFQLNEAYGDAGEDPYRICVMDIQTDKDIVTRISIGHYPMSVSPALDEPPSAPLQSD